MENVCVSQEAGCSWKFEPVTAMYILQENDGKVKARIAGKYLPNPTELNTSTQQVVELYSHWQGVKNAYDNN